MVNLRRPPATRELVGAPRCGISLVQSPVYAQENVCLSFPPYLTAKAACG